MIRWAFLTLAIASCATGAAALAVVISGGGGSFARRVEADWRLGRWRGDGAAPRASGLRSVSFDRVILEPDPPLAVTWGDWRRPLELEGVEWARPGLLPAPTRSALTDAELEFQSGTLRIAREAGGSWNIVRLLGSDSTPWFERLPRSVRGERLEVRASRRLDHDDLRFEAISPQLTRQERGARFTCALAGSAWEEGSLLLDGTGESLLVELRIDQGDLAVFPLASLRELFGMPWPADLADARGRFDLDWRRTPSGERTLLRVFQGEFAVPGVPLRVRYLSATVTADSERVVWQIDRGLVSRTRVRGTLTLSPAAGRLHGSLELEGVLEDVGLLGQLPGFWGELARAVPLRGEGRVTVELDGPLHAAVGELVREVAVEMQGVGVSGAERLDDVSGSLTLRPDRTGWQVTASTNPSRIRGLRVSATTWSGHLGRTTLEASRGEPGVDAGDPLVELRIAEAEDGIGFRLHVGDLSLESALHAGLGSHAVVHGVDMTGRWREAGGLEWRAEGTASGIVLPPDFPWPVGPPAGELSLELRVSFAGTAYRVERLDLRDNLQLWSLLGEIDRGGHVRMIGELYTDPAYRFGVITGRTPVSGSSTPFRLTGPWGAWRTERGQ